jgi:hypothetical protein
MVGSISRFQGGEAEEGWFERPGRENQAANWGFGMSKRTGIKLDPYYSNNESSANFDIHRLEMSRNPPRVLLLSSSPS